MIRRFPALTVYGNCYQVEIINDLPADKTITVYRCGPLVDLCRGPHIPNTSFVKAIECLKVCVCSVLWKHFATEFTFFWSNHINANTLVLQFQASSAYWRGDKDRESLQRVYGISFPDQKRLTVISIYTLFF
jgi:threonyl-tRNA synthetase